MIEKLNQILQGLISRSANVSTKSVSGINWTVVESGELVFLFANTAIQPTAAKTATEKDLQLPVSLQSKIGYICSSGNDQIDVLNLGIYGSDLGNDHITIQIFASNTTTRSVNVCVVGFKETA